MSSTTGPATLKRQLSWSGDFWNQVSYVLSTSDIESFSFNIAEAMSAGCTPVIYNWNGADAIWNKKHIFKDKPKFKLEPMQNMREYIINNYDLAQANNEMEAALQ